MSPTARPPTPTRARSPSLSSSRAVAPSAHEDPMKSRTWRHAAAVMAAACAVSLALPATAMAAGNSSGDVPAGEILPLGTGAHDPNQGPWFVFKLYPGEHVHRTAQLINPADVPQQVTLYPRELDFAVNGTPSVSSDPTAGIGSWVNFDKKALVVPA